MGAHLAAPVRRYQCGRRWLSLTSTAVPGPTSASCSTTPLDFTTCSPISLPPIPPFFLQPIRAGSSHSLSKSCAGLGSLPSIRPSHRAEFLSAMPALRGGPWKRTSLCTSPRKRALPSLSSLTLELSASRATKSTLLEATSLLTQGDALAFGLPRPPKGRKFRRKRLPVPSTSWSATKSSIPSRRSCLVGCTTRRVGSLSSSPFDASAITLLSWLG